MEEVHRNKLNSLAGVVNAWELIANDASRNTPCPAVSVVVTLYNYAAYITGCLDSVRASHTNGLPGGYEIVVVDDQSTDGSAGVVADYLARHPVPIRLVKKVFNSGVSDARNAGLLVARAPFVFVLDADNEIRPDCLQAHYRELASSNHAMAYGHINRFEEGTRRSLGFMSAAEWSARELVARPYIDAMAMIRKDAALRLGGYSIEYGRVLPQGWEDYDLWLKLAQAGHTGKMIPQVLSDYRVHRQSMSRDIWSWHRELAAYFARKFHSLVKQHDDLPTLFGIPRRDLAISCEESSWLQPALRNHPPTVVQRLLGRKMCRSICKRLATAYCWLHPGTPREDA